MGTPGLGPRTKRSERNKVLPAQQRSEQISDADVVVRMHLTTLNQVAAIGAADVGAALLTCSLRWKRARMKVKLGGAEAASCSKRHLYPLTDMVETPWSSAGWSSYAGIAVAPCFRTSGIEVILK